MFLENQTVLVAGGSGLIGSHLIKRLVGLGARVRATFHQKAPVIEDDRIEYVKCDLTRKEDCQKVTEGMKYVFLCAANSSGAAAISSIPMSHVTPNILINTLMLEAAYEKGVEKFLWLSSTTGYPLANHPVKEEEMFDDEPYEKYYFTGWLKRFSEILCRMYGEKLAKPMTTIVLRPTNVYGPQDDFEFETSHVLPALIRKVIERWDPIEVWGTGDDIRDLIYVDDMIDAMVMAMEKLDTFSTYNIGLGKGYSVKEILNCILDIEDYKDAKIKFDPQKPSMIPVRLVDVSKALRELNFKAKVDLEQGIRNTIDWYKKYKL